MEKEKSALENEKGRGRGSLESGGPVSHRTRDGGGGCEKPAAMTSGRFTIAVLGGLLALMLIFGAAVCIVDPYLLYHGPIGGIKPVINSSWADIREDEIYKNPGIAEYFDYDAVILGSSVTENYRASWFSREFNCNAIKLPYSNAKSKNFDIILKRIFDAKGQGIKKVFLALDTTILDKSAEETSYELPDLVYDYKPSYACRYLLNKTVYCEALKTVWMNLAGTVPDIDDAYRWDGQHEYSRENALRNSPRWPRQDEMMEPYGSIEYCRANLRNITPYIEAHPETEFYIIFSPYSILYWDLVVREGEYEQVMFNTHITMETLLPFENVRIFYFQNDKDIITDLDHYMDFLHFSADINQYMVEAMAKGEHEATNKNYLWQMDQMKKIVREYDFERLYQQQSSD